MTHSHSTHSTTDGRTIWLDNDDTGNGCGVIWQDHEDWRWSCRRCVRHGSYFNTEAAALDDFLDHEDNHTGQLDVLDDVGRAAIDLDAANGALYMKVRAARREGASWSDVGSRLGVTKQAAQQRFRDL